MERLFGSWLEQTAELQQSTYGYDPSQEEDYERWIEYIRIQTLAAFVELGEFIQKLPWKPWRKNRLPDLEGPSRDEIIEELVDVLHFIANDLYALGVSDEELSEMYQKKMNINRSRMASGGH